jgi:hypothetical protein
MTTLEVAKSYLKAGFSVIPVKADGTKTPVCRWQRFQGIHMTDEEVKVHFMEGGAAPGIVGGWISGGLTIIDIDDPLVVQPYLSVVEEMAPGLLGRLPKVKTPRDGGGLHIYFRCQSFGGSEVLARGFRDGEKKVLIETRGEGSYAIAPSPELGAHPSRRPYVVEGDVAIEDTPMIDEEGREALFLAASSLDEYQEDGKSHEPERPILEERDLRPGDDYALSGPDFATLLEPAGWTISRETQKGILWCKPGRSNDCHATTGYCKGKDGRPLFKVFSTNASPFDAKAYDRFHVLTLLRFEGDYSKAASWLSKEGYGQKIETARVPWPKEPQEDPETTQAHWPIMESLAYHGIAGDFVRLTEPQTEADPVNLLITFLTIAGNHLGRKPAYRIESTLHRMNLFSVIVAASGEGRKGTGSDRVLRLFEHMDGGAYLKTCVGTNLSSGEGVIARLSPPRDQDGNLIPDAAERDPRFLIQNSEFASTLRVMKREGNQLSQVLRQGWDGSGLEVLTKKDPLKVDNHHISLVGHITPVEIRRELTEIDKGSGTANRILWIMSRRSKSLPLGGASLELEYKDMARKLKPILEKAGKIPIISLSTTAEDAWIPIYEDLTRSREDLGEITASILSRAAPQCLRVASIYALLDGTPKIEPIHLKAAHAIIRYVEASVRYIWSGRSDREKLFHFILSKGKDGASMTEIHGFYSNNKDTLWIHGLLGPLGKAGKLKRVMVKNGLSMKTEERWIADDKKCH